MKPIINVVLFGGKYFSDYYKQQVLKIRIGKETKKGFAFALCTQNSLKQRPAFILFRPLGNFEHDDLIFFGCL